MRIGFITKGNPNNKRQWSGTVAHMYSEMCKDHEVVILDIEKKRSMLKLIHKVCSKVIKMTTGKTYLATYSINEALADSRQVAKEIKKNKDLDIIFCPARSGSITFLKTRIPIVYLTDGTFKQMDGYYPYLSNLCNITKVTGNYIEQRAILNASFVIAASDWTKDSIISDYHYPADQVETICFGANIADCAEKNKKNQTVKQEINLLFCGVEWDRKGGDTAVETYRYLREQGRNVNLWLVGCTPPFEVNDDGIKCIGFLNKNNQEEAGLLESIYGNADFLLLPTTAECAGIVFIEASSHGIPSITYDTGGVASYVQNGINGYRLPLGSSASEFARVILQCCDDDEKMENLRKSSMSVYREKYNWTEWEKQTNLLFEKIKRKRDI